MNAKLQVSCLRRTISRPAHRVAIAAFLFASVFTVKGFAQTERTPQDDRAAVRTDSQAQAAALFVEGRDTEAVALLASTNIRPAGTAGWHTETAGRLLHIAWAFSTEGKKELADRVALLSFGETVAAVKVAGEREPARAAAALLTAALIQERFLGDLEAAKASLRRAREIDPENVPARESLDRFERAERQDASRNSVN